jgi:transposase-like protein
MMTRRSWRPEEKERRQVQMMKMLGVRVEDIARVIGVSEPTLRKHCRRELDLGKIVADTKVISFLYSQACGEGPDPRANVTAAIFWLKSQCRWRETVVAEIARGADAESARRVLDEELDRMAERLRITRGENQGR